MKAFIALCILGLVSQAFAAEEDVLVLTDSTFDENVNSAELILVEFYAPWCGHCKNLAPKYAEAAGILKKNDPAIPIAKVDCTTETGVCGKYGVTGYPTLKVFRNGSPSDYKGGRETNAIVSFMKKNVGPDAKSLTTAAEAKTFVTQAGDISVVGYFPTEGDDSANFKKAASLLREEFKLGLITDQSVADSIGLGKGGIAVFRSSEKNPEIFSGAGSVSDWIYEQAVAFPGEITKDNIARFTRTGLPILKLYTDVNWKSNLKQTNYYLNRLKKIAEDSLFKGKLLFAIADKAAHSDETGKFGITSFPGVAIDDQTNAQKYRFTEDFSIPAVVQWAKDVLEGKVKGYIKSEPTPDQTGPVTIVTGENFKEIVLDDQKDVLLEIYAPWCGHCKNLAPAYEELATNLKDVDNLVIAKMDATVNDSPHGKYQAKGYPTILFSPAGSKNEPIAYSGARDVKSFTEFLKKESKNSNFAAATKAEL